jgi:hypothetical protein
VEAAASSGGSGGGGDGHKPPPFLLSQAWQRRSGAQAARCRNAFRCDGWEPGASGKGASIKLVSPMVAKAGREEGQAVRSRLALPASGRSYFEVTFSPREHTQGGGSLGGCYFFGVVDGAKKTDFASKRTLSHTR